MIFMLIYRQSQRCIEERAHLLVLCILYCVFNTGAL